MGGSFCEFPLLSLRGPLGPWQSPLPMACSIRMTGDSHVASLLGMTCFWCVQQYAKLKFEQAYRTGRGQRSWLTAGLPDSHCLRALRGKLKFEIKMRMDRPPAKENGRKMRPSKCLVLIRDRMVTANCPYEIQKYYNGWLPGCQDLYRAPMAAARAFAVSSRGRLGSPCSGSQGTWMKPQRTWVPA